MHRGPAPEGRGGQPPDHPLLAAAAPQPLRGPPVVAAHQAGGRAAGGLLPLQRGLLRPRPRTHPLFIQTRPVRTNAEGLAGEAVSLVSLFSIIGHHYLHRYLCLHIAMHWLTYL